MRADLDTPRLDEAIVALVEAIRAEVRAATPDPEPDRLLSVAEAADILGVGRTALYGLLASGRLRSVHVGRRRLVPESAIEDFVEGLDR